MMKLSEKCHPSKKNRDPYGKVAHDPCCEPYAQPSAKPSSLGKIHVEWDWMSNVPLQCHSMAAFTCSWPAVSHHLLLCGQV